jgi:hypothetical protein
MASLISAGVSVTVTDESFYIPAAAPTVPLIFIATEYGKNQPDGVTPALGTLEHSVVRTITSIRQSMQLYGIPSFRRDLAGNEFHGDARNEYGLLALNNALGQLNRAFVVRADVDLADKPDTFMTLGIPALTAAPVFGPGAVGNGQVTNITASSANVKPQTFNIRFVTQSTFTVNGTVVGHVGNGSVGVPFISNQVNFTVSAGSSPFVVCDNIHFEMGYVAERQPGMVGNGDVIKLLPDELALPETVTIEFTSATTYNVVGQVSIGGSGMVGTPFDNNYLNFTVVAGSVPFAIGDRFEITVSEVTTTNPLGANDDARRLAIVTALQSEINMNTEVRSELYEYNLILCPGYYETVDELNRLAGDILEEAFVIADTPGNKTPSQVTAWGKTSERYRTSNVAYYYPWALMSNLDGRDVLGAPSGVALRTFAYNDNAAYVWQAPAGANRGVVTGVSKLGYFTGTAGEATTFVECNLNQGQRDALYEQSSDINPIAYFPGRGMLVWGQKTSAPAASSMDRINVSRLVVFLRRALRKGGFPFVFEINDATTQKNLKSAIDGILSDVMTKRGIYDFYTQCDSGNNTPDRIDRNELWADVAIKPAKVSEFVYIPIRLVSTGGEL